MSKQTFFFIHPDQKSAHADKILNLTRTSYERSTGRKWDDVTKTTKVLADKWLMDIKSMNLTEQTYVVLYILHYFYNFSSTDKLSNLMEKLLADKALKTARNIIWLCVDGRGDHYGDVTGKVEPMKPFTFNNELTIVDVQDLEGEKIDEFITNYETERV